MGSLSQVGLLTDVKIGLACFQDPDERATCTACRALASANSGCPSKGTPVTAAATALRADRPYAALPRGLQGSEG